MGGGKWWGTGKLAEPPLIISRPSMRLPDNCCRHLLSPHLPSLLPLPPHTTSGKRRSFSHRWRQQQ